MTVLTNTTQTFNIGTAGGIREDLEDKIWDLFPEDTWALTNLDKVDATSTFHEWLGQQLAAPAANIQIEGDDASFSVAAAPSRFATHTQIASKTFLISDSLEATNRAGRAKEAARVMVVKMRELKRDIEQALTQNQASTIGGAGTGRSTAGMETWIGGVTADPSTGGASNAVRSTTTAQLTTTPAVTSGAAGTAPTDGATLGPLTKVALDMALCGSWTAGGNPRVILTNTIGKIAIDNITSIATRFVDVAKGDQGSIVGAANVYVSDYGVHQVILHRYMRTSVVLCLDPDYWSIAQLRGFQKRQLAKTGDGEKYQVIWEGGLEARNWKASSKVVAVNG